MSSRRKETIKHDESPVRKIVQDSKREKYNKFLSLKAALHYKDAYLVMEGDCGGQIYLTVPVKFVKCNEKTLRSLLNEIDSLAWKDPECAGFYFERRPIGEILIGGMGGGKIQDDLWVHKELEYLKEKIRLILKGKVNADDLIK